LAFLIVGNLGYLPNSPAEFPQELLSKSVQDLKEGEKVWIRLDDIKIDSNGKTWLNNTAELFPESAEGRAYLIKEDDLKLVIVKSLIYSHRFVKDVAGDIKIKSV